MTLTQLKTQATRTEFARVYNNFNLPARDIVVEHNGARYIRYAWHSVNRFGWTAWMRQR